jgi:hypothetical protein
VRSERLAAPLAALLLAGCGGTAADLDRDCTFATGPVTGAWVPIFGGHSYDWLYLSHRVAYLRAGVELPEDDGAFEVPLGLIGGDWSTGQFADDYPWYRVEHTRVSTDAVQAWFGSTDLEVPAAGRAEATVSVDLAAAGLPPEGRKVVILQGLCFDTDVPLAEGYDGSYDPGLGWTVRGMGAGVRAGAASDEALDVIVEAHFQAGPLDRADLNEAIPSSRVRATVLYSILNVPDGDLTPATHRSSMFFASQGESYTATPLPPEEERRVRFVGSPDRPVALPLLHSFDFELNAASDPDRAGRYLRGWHARLDTFDYAPETGVADLLVDAWASHSSALQEGDLEVEFRAALSMLQLPLEATPVRGTTTGTFEIGAPLGSRRESVPAP